MNTMSVLEYYKEMKAIHTDPVFGIDPSFPDWKTFKADYEKEYYADRVVVSEEEADAILDEVVETAERELGLIPDLPVEEEPDNVYVLDVEDEAPILHLEEIDPIEPEYPEEVEVIDLNEKSARAKVRTPRMKKATTKKAVTKKTTTSQPKKGAKRMAKTKSKADLARTIFKRIGHKERKKVIAAFVEKAGLTAAGAATYYQKFKTEGI